VVSHLPPLYQKRALLKAPYSINVDMMSTTQIRDMLDDGLSDIDNGRVRPARETFARFRDERSE
jgi:hypothetical protein